MDQHNKLWTTFVVIIALALFAFLVDIPQLPSWIPGNAWFSKQSIHLGLDLQGGTQLMFSADMSDIPSNQRTSAIEGVRDVIERRVNIFGVAEPVIQTAKVKDKWRLIVELPGVKDVNEAIGMIGETPILEFKEPAPERDLTQEEKQQIEEYNQKAKERTQDILVQALVEGADFDTLAKQYSEDPGSKDQGGDLGWFGKGAMIPKFEKAVFEDLAVGEITKELVQSQFGYHIIYKTDERVISPEVSVEVEGEEGGETEVEPRPEVRASHILIAILTEEIAKQSIAQWQYTGLTGKQLKAAFVSFNSQTNQPEISLEFNDEGTKLFGEITTRNVGKPVAIFLDNSPLSIPNVREAITTGRAVITGDFSVPEARQLAQRLEAGALPVPITLISQQNVGPSLGKISVQKSFVAGILGFIIIVILMISLYRFRGLLASVALFIYILIVMALFKLIPVTLTLAGVAGFILSLGMAVDANILIFERIKDEERLGKPLKTAIDDGIAHAWTAIRDGNITTLIVCFILYQFGTGLVRGFGLTLGIGILMSMFTAIVVTKTFLKLTTK
ncbi:protein translocase subunit SecD [Patescibacteria group bacterium AH-259-L05]|nr:protein translocase subunit SecD [Patescibacteria group bacterium AH-259-L05]